MKKKRLLLMLQYLAEGIESDEWTEDTMDWVDAYASGLTLYPSMQMLRFEDDFWRERGGEGPRDAYYSSAMDPKQAALLKRFADAFAAPKEEECAVFGRESEDGLMDNNYYITEESLEEDIVAEAKAAEKISEGTTLKRHTTLCIETTACAPTTVTNDIHFSTSCNFLNSETDKDETPTCRTLCDDTSKKAPSHIEICSETVPPWTLSSHPLLLPSTPLPFTIALSPSTPCISATPPSAFPPPSPPPTINIPPPVAGIPTSPHLTPPPDPPPRLGGRTRPPRTKIKFKLTAPAADEDPPWKSRAYKNSHTFTYSSYLPKGLLAPHKPPPTGGG
jgi:hypothetical protein